MMIEAVRPTDPRFATTITVAIVHLHEELEHHHRLQTRTLLAMLDPELALPDVAQEAQLIGVGRVIAIENGGLLLGAAHLQGVMIGRGLHYLQRGPHMALRIEHVRLDL